MAAISSSLYNILNITVRFHLHNRPVTTKCFQALYQTHISHRGEDILINCLCYTARVSQIQESRASYKDLSPNPFDPPPLTNTRTIYVTYRVIV